MGKRVHTKEEIATRKRERFVRVASDRTQKALDALQALGKCAEPRIYVYDEEDLKKILAAIDDGVQDLKDTFAGRKRFSLSSDTADRDF